MFKWIVLGFAALALAVGGWLGYTATHQHRCAKFDMFNRCVAHE
jgi:hypothetical protein